MAEYLVTVERTYRSRHVATMTTVADSPEEAEENAHNEMECGSFDPTDDYTDMNPIEGYDNAANWEVVSATEVSNG